MPIKRIAVTLPPAHFFHGIARSLFDLYRQAFVDLGLSVFTVPVDAFLPPDASRIAGLVTGLRSFAPDAAFGLSHGLYALLCRLPAGRDGWKPNLFTEVLDIPTICLWDHAPLELADEILKPHPQAPSSSTAGAMEILRRTLTHPRLIHWSRDSGQTRIMRELGFLRPGRLIHEPPPSLPGFSPREAPVEPGVGFVGHFYQEPVKHPHPVLAALECEATAEWLAGTRQPLWDVLLRRIAGMDAEQRRELALDRDQSYFWQYAHRLILHRAQTAQRLKMLGGAGVPVSCYGDLRTELPGVPKNLVSIAGHLPFGPALSAALARHAITIDVMNPGFVHGYSHKPILIFASGGCLLMDRKQDFVDVFGEAGEAASYDGAEDLGTKVEGFLSKPAYRREVGDVIREEIAARYQLTDVLRRVLHRASEAIERDGPRGAPAKLNAIERPAAMIMELLTEMRTEPEWDGSTVEHGERGALISTSPRTWMYAASIAIPPLVGTMREPHLRMSMLVQEGRIGVAARRDDNGDLLTDQLVSPTSEAITITVELPHGGASKVILRNTAEGVSRALVLRASLCDRS